MRDRIKALVKICRLRAKVNRQVSRKCQHVTFSSRSQNFWFWPAVPFASRPAALTTVSIVADSASGRKMPTPLGSRIRLGDGFDAADHLTSPELVVVVYGYVCVTTEAQRAGRWCGLRGALCVCVGQLREICQSSGFMELSICETVV